MCMPYAFWNETYCCSLQDLVFTEPQCEMVHSLRGHVTCITSLVFSPSGLFLASGCAKGWLNIWSLQVGRVRFYGISFSPPSLVYIFSFYLCCLTLDCSKIYYWFINVKFISYWCTNDILEYVMQMNLASCMSSPFQSDSEPSFKTRTAYAPMRWYHLFSNLLNFSGWFSVTNSHRSWISSESVVVRWLRSSSLLQQM